MQIVFMSPSTSIFPLHGPRLWWTILATLVLTSYTLQWSQREGRLAYELNWDDIVYAQDGWKRLQVFETGGVPGLAQSYRKDTPHSLTHSIQAFLAFALFGPRDWAPYALNAGWLFLWLAAAGIILRRADWPVWAAFLLILLSFSLSFSAIHEFLPDFAVGLCTALFLHQGLCLLLDHGDASPKNTALRAGVFLSLAFLSKPAFFPQTLLFAVLLGFLLLARTQSWWILPSRRWSYREGWVLIIFWLIPVLLTAGPFFLFHGGQFWQYLTAHALGGSHAGVWRLEGDFVRRLVYFVFDYEYGAARSLGHGHTLALLVSVAGGIWLAWNRVWRILLFITLLWIFAVLSWCILILGGMFGLFFAVAPQVLLVLAMAEILASLPRRKWLIVVALVLVPVWWFAVPNPSLRPHFHWYQSESVRKPDSVPGRMVEEVKNHWRTAQNSAGPVHVFFTFAAEVNAANFQWIAQRSGLPFLTEDRHLSGAPSVHQAGWETADFVVAAEPGVVGEIPWLPSTPLQPQLIEALDGDSTWNLSARLDSGNGRAFLVYARVSASQVP